MTRTHLNTTRAGQCNPAALHLSATHSPGMRWMTYSVSEVFEPVAQEDKKKETHLRKTVQEKKWVFGLSCLQHKNLNTHMQSLNMHSEYHR